MTKIDRDFLDPKCEVATVINFNRIAERLSAIEAKQNFLAKLPGEALTWTEETYHYHGDMGIPVEKGDVQVTASKYTTNNTYDIKITLSGMAKTMSAGVKAALGFSTQTHAAIALIEMPTSKASEITYNSGALEDGDIVVIDNRAYLILVKGVYDSSGTVTSASTSFTVAWNGITVKYLWDYSELILEGVSEEAAVEMV